MYQQLRGVLARYGVIALVLIGLMLAGLRPAMACGFHYPTPPYGSSPMSNCNNYPLLNPQLGGIGLPSMGSFPGGSFIGGFAGGSGPNPFPYGCIPSTGAPGGTDPTDLATGDEAYTPPDDLAVYNTVGPNAYFQRAYYSRRATGDDNYYPYGSSGLPIGWVHNYDVTIQPNGQRTGFNLWFPNEAYESLFPQYDANHHYTGIFTTDRGAEYTAVGVPPSGQDPWPSITLTFRNQTQWQFTPADNTGNCYRLTRITNRMGRYITLTWDTTGKLLSVTNDQSLTLLSLTYSSGYLTSVSDCYGRQVSYTIGSYQCRVSQFELPLGSGNYTCLLSVSQVTPVNTPNPPVHYSFTYGVVGRWIPPDKDNSVGFTLIFGPFLTGATVPSPTGIGTSSFSLEYDDDFRVRSFCDANGTVQEYTYGTPLTGSTQVSERSNDFSINWTQNFDRVRDSGRTDAEGRTWLKQYADSNNPYKVTGTVAPDGTQTAAVYDTMGNLTASVDIYGVSTHCTYDYSTCAFGRLTQVQRGTHTPTTLTYYEPCGLVHTVTAPLPGSTTGQTATRTFTYDALGNLLTATEPGNNTGATLTTTYNYTTDGAYSQPEARGEPLTITDPLGKVTHFRYDNRGNLLSVTDPAGNVMANTYDTNADQVLNTKIYRIGLGGVGYISLENTYLYPGGPLTQTQQINELGQLVKRQVYAYNADGGPKTLTSTVYNPDGTVLSQTQDAYGLQGELLSHTGDIDAATYTYNTLLRPTSMTDADGHTTTYTYGDMTYPERLTQVTYPGGDMVNYTSFDIDDRPLTVVDGNGVTTTLAYQPDGQLTSASHASGGNVTYAYNTDGQCTTMVDQTGQTSYTYDDLGDLLQVGTTFTGLPEKDITYAYYPDGSRQSMTTPAGVYTYTYDADGRPISEQNPAGKLSQWSYQPDGRLAQRTLGNRAWTSYHYDAYGRLSRLTNFSPLGRVLSDFSNMTYDTGDNQTSVAATLPGLPHFGGTTAETFTQAQLLTQEASGRNGGFGGAYSFDQTGNPTVFNGTPHPSYNANNQLTETGYTYDGNGNPTTYHGNQLTYNAVDQLTQFADSGHNVLLSAGYNGYGMRAWKSSGGSQTYFLYDGAQIVCELNAAGTVTASQTWGPDGLLARNDTWYLFDQQGNVNQRIDTKGKISSTVVYDAWGNLQTGGNSSDPNGYQAQWGYYTDHETGLILCTLRYYDPTTGRWLTRDPIGYDGGNDMYAYCANNPVMGVDPLGLVNMVVLYVGNRSNGTERGDIHLILKRREYYRSHGYKINMVDGPEWKLDAALRKLVNQAGPDDKIGFVYVGHERILEYDDHIYDPNTGRTQTVVRLDRYLTASVPDDGGNDCIAPTMLAYSLQGRTLDFAEIYACESNRMQEVINALVGGDKKKYTGFSGPCFPDIEALIK